MQGNSDISIPVQQALVQFSTLLDVDDLDQSPDVKLVYCFSLSFGCYYFIDLNDIGSMHQ